MKLSLEGAHLANWVMKSPSLTRRVVKVAEWYRQKMGYRQMGLKYDDLLIEENDHVQKALARLSDRESYDRVFRLRRAQQLSLLHRELPAEEWTKPEEDTPYLSSLIEEVKAEEAEREAWDTIKVKKNNIH